MTEISEDVSPPQSDFDAFHQRLRHCYADLPKRLVQLADFVSASPDEVALGTVSSLAGQAGVQPSTVVRFARTLGFAGFSDMQAVFRDRLRVRNVTYRDRVNALHRVDGEPLEASVIFNGFYEAALDSLHALQAHLLPDRLEAAVTTLAQADCLYLLGLRRSMPVIRYLSYLLAKLDIRHQIIGLETGMEEESFLHAGPQDAALVLSYTAYAPRTIELFNALEARQVPVISMTDSAGSPVIPQSGLWLEVHEADFQGFRSNAASMVLVSTLAAAIAERRG
ncbi:MurR/RpiR family transcriptional regulator [Asaia lannensis]|uniref:MurR/RpiR family transcriptional regulator n=1 Tax=Asaia lannensis NBRC 102526 TaxID=1307926 RepID=A0ABT1CCY2_9PROT|nr:MurR/RpiR family transcriptional regulator [Asaia lannensis]MCO6158725.1 MurR/RpiR family transcriptional regulator [Asaia lannensis NBRC 102526]GBR00375.1 RpiR family transcriptional regulator [Asaia lannensis NBRC 102526]